MEEKKKLSAFDKRIHEIDFFRGILILLVIIDHIFIFLGDYSAPDRWNVPWMYGFFHDFYSYGDLRSTIQPIVLMMFCFVSGISCAFSRNNIKRGIQTICVAAFITLYTHFMQWMVDIDVLSFLKGGSYIIDFNIIGVLGLSMLIYGLIQKRSWKIILVVILVSFYISNYLMPSMRENFSNWFGYVDGARPGMWYKIPKVIIPFFWEPVYPGDHLTADYVPLFPFIIFFFVGALVSYAVYMEKKQSIFKHKFNWERPVCFLGRHTLLIYFGQIVVILGIFTLIDTFVKMAR